MGRLLAASVCGALLLGGCATLRGEPRGAELAGETLRVETVRGEVTMLRFGADGMVRADFQRGSVVGRWGVDRSRLCFFWTGAPQECWPYRERFRPGRTRTITSDRGNIVRVTML